MEYHFNRWGRGHPEQYTEAIALGEDKFDPEADKKPRAGQILWIRGLTRLQTQVSCVINLLLEFNYLLRFFFCTYYYTIYVV